MENLVAKSPPPALFRFAADQWTQPWWDAARQHVLTACRCGSCGQFRMPPTAYCPHCRSQSVEWPVLSGKGIIFSFTIVNRAVTPEMADYLPYVPAIITLPDADNVRIFSNIIGVPIGSIRIGGAVEAVWEDLEEASLIRFRPA